MPETVPLAKPPRPSASIHSALKSIRFMTLRWIDSEQQNDEHRDDNRNHGLASGFEPGIKRHAAVDKKRGALDVIGLVARQPNRGTTDLFRFADALVGNQLEQVGVMLGRVPGLHVNRGTNGA